jgi:hypothetical protein
MNTFKQAAIKILKKSSKPLHYHEITKLALEEGILETEGATPENTMNTQISIDIKNKGKSSDFIKVAPSTYSLNKNKIVKISNKIKEKEIVEEERIKIEGGYTGKAG